MFRVSRSSDSPVFRGMWHKGSGELTQSLHGNMSCTLPMSPAGNITSFYLNCLLIDLCVLTEALKQTNKQTYVKQGVKE